jgi:hypothetical protein
MTCPSGWFRAKWEMHAPATLYGLHDGIPCGVRRSPFGIEPRAARLENAPGRVRLTKERARWNARRNMSRLRCRHGLSVPLRSVGPDSELSEKICQHKISDDADPGRRIVMKSTWVLLAISLGLAGISIGFFSEPAQAIACQAVRFTPAPVCRGKKFAVCLSQIKCTLPRPGKTATLCQQYACVPRL